MKRSTIICIVVLVLCVFGISMNKYREKVPKPEPVSVPATTAAPAENRPILRRNHAVPVSESAPTEENEAAPELVALEPKPVQTEVPAPAATPEPVKAAPTETPKFAPEEQPRSFVLNTSSMKFHFPSCSSVKKIAEHNRRDVEMTRSEIINMGYEPCGKCHP